MAESAARGTFGLQFSIYPLRQARLQPSVEAAVRAAGKGGLEVAVGKLSTVAVGDEEAVFAALRAAFDAARANGPTVMVATISTGVPDDATIAEVQVAARD
jgi:uncharacterized protein YqgV (UPF0045/DUF77 family)